MAALAKARLAGYKSRVLEPAKRPRTTLRLLAGFAALAAIGGLFVVKSAAEAKRDVRVADLVHSACDHTGLSHVALERLVRQERNAAKDQNQAVQAITAFCLANR
jgi:hypothetical protein